MTRVCTICAHPCRAEIDRAAIAGASYRTIADQFHVSKTALLRHKADHLLAELVKAHEAKELADADQLMAEAETYKKRMLGTWDRAEAIGDFRAEVAAGNGVRGYLELMAKLVGLIDSRPVVNVVMSAEWVTVRSVLMQALLPFGDARAAVASALLQLEEQTSNGKLTV